MADWRYLVVRQTRGGAEWIASGVGVEMDFAENIPVEQMLHRCGAFGWELVAIGYDYSEEVFYFKKLA